jgi:hypothetical protein
MECAREHHRRFTRPYQWFLDLTVPLELAAMSNNYKGKVTYAER